MSKLTIVPLGLKGANDYVEKMHRHHKPVRGCKFCIGVMSDGELHGVAICGRPVSRYYDNGLTLEITRLCTDGTFNACSKLYGACVRIARNMGYTRIVTYTLESEDGASLRASNFRYDGRAGKPMWTGSRSGRDTGAPKEFKKRWIFEI